MSYEIYEIVNVRLVFFDGDYAVLSRLTNYYHYPGKCALKSETIASEFQENKWFMCTI